MCLCARVCAHARRERGGTEPRSHHNVWLKKKRVFAYTHPHGARERCMGKTHNQKRKAERGRLRTAEALVKRADTRAATTVAADLRQAFSLPSSHRERPDQGQRPVSSHVAAAHLVLAATEPGHPSARSSSSNQTGGHTGDIQQSVPLTTKGPEEEHWSPASEKDDFAQPEFPHTAEAGGVRAVQPSQQEPAAQPTRVRTDGLELHQRWVWAEQWQ